MELKNKKDIKKNLKKKKFKMSKSISESSKSNQTDNEFNVFEFINNTLCKKQTNIESKDKYLIKRDKFNLITKTNNSPSTSANSDRLIMLETHNKIKDYEKMVIKLKQSLNRNKNR